MIEFVEVYFCERLEYNPDGSPRECINRFRRWHLDTYPGLFRFAVVINFAHRSALRHVLALRIKHVAEIVFLGAFQYLEFAPPPRGYQEVSIVADLPDINIPRPGDYKVEILLKGIVWHQEALFFT